MSKGKKILFRFLSIVIGIGGCVVFLDYMYIMCACLVVSIMLWLSTNKSEKETLDTTGLGQVVGLSRYSVNEIFEAFKEVDTPLGRPWRSKAGPVVRDGIVFGPGSDNHYIICYFMGKNWNVYNNSLIGGKFGIDEEGARIHKVEVPGTISKNDAICMQISDAFMTDCYCDMFEHFVKTKEAKWVRDSNVRYGKVYFFNEQFKLFGQNFQMVDAEGRPVYDIKGTAPLLQFKIYEAGTDYEVFSATKEILHILPHYRFYKNGELYGEFERENILSPSDVFTMELPEGKLLMRGNTMLGGNYIVRLNGKIIGSICERMNLNIKDLLFDNYMVHVVDERYRPLMATLAIMASREEARDR